MNKIGLIGFPLSHSFSATYFKAKFDKENISDWEYNNYPIENIDLLPELLNKTENLKGLNVTIPYKEQVLKYLDEIDAEAKEIGAVNTLKITKKENKTHIKGFNTDIYGFEKSIKPLLEFHHKNALILGTGGASKAVAYVFKKLGIKYKFVSRTPKNKQTISYESITEKNIKDYRIIVNTTPLGTFPNVLEFPKLPYFGLTKLHVLFDLVYNPSQTRFLEFGKQYGAVTKNGYEMLELQAEKAWDIFLK